MLMMRRASNLIVAAALLVAPALTGCGGGGPATTTITGQVLVAPPPGSAPVPGALVILGGRKGLTDDQGQFRIEGVPAVDTPLPITVSRTNFLTYDATLIPSVDTPIVILLRPVEEPAHAGTLAGRVLAQETGAGIGQTAVTAEVLGPDVVTFSATAHSANDGEFQLSGIPTGSVRLRVSAQGRLSTEQQLLVTAGDTNPPLEIRLALTGSTCTVTGRVFDLLTYAPVSGALVLTAGGLRATTDNSGAFTIAEVPAGTSQFLVTAEGYDSATRTVAVVCDSAPLAIGLIKAGSAPPGLPYNLSGTVLLAGATDHSGVTISLLSQAGPPLEQTVTDRAGRFAFWYFPGAYTLLVEKPGYLTQRREISLPLGGRVTADFQLAGE